MTLYTEVFSNSVPRQNRTVLFDIRGPANPYANVTMTGIAQTNASGAAEFTFRLPWYNIHPEEISFGQWRARATTELDGYQLGDAVTFQNGYIIEILSIEIGSMRDGVWIPRTTFARKASDPFFQTSNNDSLQVRMTAKNIMFTATNVWFTFALQDSSQVPFALLVLNYSMPGSSNETLISGPMFIPYWVSLGVAKAFVYALDKPPQDLTHIIYSEMTSSFSIIDDLYPPVTSYYSGSVWYTDDVTINLSGRDNSGGVGVSETYYTINGGPVRTVRRDGQPRITTEGAYNQLVYWSVDLAGNEEQYHSSVTIRIDRHGPNGSIQINNNVAYSTSPAVKLTLSAVDSTSGVDRVRYNNIDNWTNIEWEFIVAAKNWTLTPGDGIKTVYYQARDKAGLVSTFSDQIILDTTPPTGTITIANGASNSSSTTVTLTLAAEDTTSGVAQMRFSNDNTTWTAWEPYSNKKTWSLTSGDGNKTVYVQYRDNAGLVSSSYQDQINLTTTNPAANPQANDNQPFPMWVLGASVIIVAFAIATVILARRHRQK